MNHKRWILAALLAAVLLCAAGITLAAQDGPTPARPPDPARVRDHIVQGQVVAVTGDEATIQTGGGLSVTLHLGDDTQYWVPGSPPTHTLALAPGDPLLVFGRSADAGEPGGVRTMDARVVVVVEPDDVPRYVVAGPVVAVTSETIVVRARRGERAVTVLPRTRLAAPQGRLDSLRDIRPGEQILALGQPTELGQWIAGLVLTTGRNAAAPPSLRGEVMAVDVDAGRLEVDTLRRGTVTVEVTQQTRYRIAGVESPTLADVRPGDQVAITGRVASADPLVVTAQNIAVLRDDSGD